MQSGWPADDDASLTALTYRFVAFDWHDFQLGLIAVERDSLGLKR